MRKTYIIRTLIISLAAMIIFGAVSMLLIGHYSRETAKNDLRRLSDVIKDEAERKPDAITHLVTYENTGDAAFRVTFIDLQGNVLADSVPQTNENHSDRPEVKAALKGSPEFDIRKSTTLNCRMMYYAVTYEDKSGAGGETRILRVGLEITSVSRAVWSALPVLIAVTLVLAGALVLVSNKYNNSILTPVNMLKGQLQNINSGNYEKIGIDKSNREMLPVINEINEIGESLQKLNKMRSEFFANASHELNTPLTCIAGYSELMQAGLTDAKQIKEIGAKINSEAAHMSALITDMLKLSSLENANPVIKLEPVNIREIIDSAVGTLSNSAAGKDVKIQVQCWEKDIYSDGNLLKTIIINLLDNAVKYNVQGGKVTAAVRKTETDIEITVRDTGIGISQKDRERLFERFYRADKARGKKSGGTGLGLAIVKHSAAALGGTVTVESREKEGTVFTVVLPINKLPETEPQPAAVE